MGKAEYLWKCEACAGWLNLGRDITREQPVLTACECSCMDPDIQQPLAEMVTYVTTGISQEHAPLDAIDRVLHACQSIRDEVSRTERVRARGNDSHGKKTAG